MSKAVNESLEEITSKVTKYAGKAVVPAEIYHGVTLFIDDDSIIYGYKDGVVDKIGMRYITSGNRLHHLYNKIDTCSSSNHIISFPDLRNSNLPFTTKCSSKDKMFVKDIKEEYYKGIKILHYVPSDSYTIAFNSVSSRFVPKLDVNPIYNGKEAIKNYIDQFIKENVSQNISHNNRNLDRNSLKALVSEIVTGSRIEVSEGSGMVSPISICIKYATEPYYLAHTKYYIGFTTQYGIKDNKAVYYLVPDKVDIHETAYILNPEEIQKIIEAISYSTYTFDNNDNTHYDHNLHEDTI